MNVVLSFIGKMPEYSYECIKQLRFFYDGPVYLIYDSISDELFNKLNTLNIIYVHYEKVKSREFDEKVSNRNFAIVDGLKDRRLLFKRSYERFFLLKELMVLYDLKYVWFMELDIMMYCDPNIFLEYLKTISTAYSYHRTDHCNSGIFYVRDQESLDPILESFVNFTNGFLSEMRALYDYTNKVGMDSTTFFPLLFPTQTENKLFWKDYDKFQNHIFDGAILGIYYFGVDPVHTNGQIKTRDPNTYDIKIKFLNVWNYGEMIWKKDANGLNIPYFKINNTDTYLPIANLHIHSKDLKSALSSN
jgi:hypothetical protein